jgi:endonuclease YncB( thermonuclease family)
MPANMPPAIICEHPTASDGDTMRCRNIAGRIRLVGIDAPELPGHCNPDRRCTPGDGYASREALRRLLQICPVRVLPQGRDDYGRMLARVTVNGVDVSCRMVALGAAVRRYARIVC